jgi:hypothetical protein
MKVRVLRSALEDLANGREFYNQQQEGVGDYFFDSLVSEIDSLVLYAGIHRVQFGYHRLLARRFPYAAYYRVVCVTAACLSVCNREGQGDCAAVGGGRLVLGAHAWQSPSVQAPIKTRTRDCARRPRR